MRIATFNINGVNRRLPNLLAWLTDAGPDVVCLQELKAEQGAFPEAALRGAGYRSVWVGQRSWNGVAILARGSEPVVTRRTLPGGGDDEPARYIEAAVQGVLVGCLYAPNGNPFPGPKFEAKLAWNERLLAHAAGLLEAGVPAVLAGDYNIVPSPADIYNERSWRDNALLQPEPRAQFGRLLDAGWTDVLGPGDWTFWSVLRNGWARDAGMRIDHLLVSPAAAGWVRAAGVDRAVRGETGASDHAPAWVELSAP